MIQTTVLLVVAAWVLSEPRVRRAIPIESLAAFIVMAITLGLIFVVRWTM